MPVLEATEDIEEGLADDLAMGESRTNAVRVSLRNIREGRTAWTSGQPSKIRAKTLSRIMCVCMFVCMYVCLFVCLPAGFQVRHGTS